MEKWDSYMDTFKRRREEERTTYGLFPECGSIEEQYAYVLRVKDGNARRSAMQLLGEGPRLEKKIYENILRFLQSMPEGMPSLSFDPASLTSQNLLSPP